MDRISFHIKVREIAEKKPKLFAIESDGIVDPDRITEVEKYYDVIFPDSYKDFLSQYGGGYFGLIVVYSCDCNGMFYIKDTVSKEWVEEKKFLPIVDFETGDFVGFKIESGICKGKVSLYSHEEDKLHDMNMELYEVLLKYGLNCDK